MRVKAVEKLEKKIDTKVLEVSKKELVDVLALVEAAMVKDNPTRFLIMDEIAEFSALVVTALFDDTELTNKILSEKEKM